MPRPFLFWVRKSGTTTSPQRQMKDSDTSSTSSTDLWHFDLSGRRRQHSLRIHPSPSRRFFLFSSHRLQASPEPIPWSLPSWLFLPCVSGRQADQPRRVCPLSFGTVLFLPPIAPGSSPCTGVPATPLQIFPSHHKTPDHSRTRKSLLAYSFTEKISYYLQKGH